MSITGMLSLMALVSLLSTDLLASHKRGNKQDTIRRAEAPRQARIGKTVPFWQESGGSAKWLPDKDVKSLPTVPKIYWKRVERCFSHLDAQKSLPDNVKFFALDRRYTLEQGVPVSRGVCFVAYVKPKDYRNSQIGLVREALRHVSLKGAGRADLGGLSASDWPDKSELAMYQTSTFGVDATGPNGFRLGEAEFGIIRTDSLSSDKTPRWKKLGLRAQVKYSRKGKKDTTVLGTGSGEMTYRPFRHGKVRGMQVEFDYKEWASSNLKPSDLQAVPLRFTKQKPTTVGRMAFRFITHDEHGKKLGYPRFQVGHVEAKDEQIKGAEFKQKLSSLNWDWRNLVFRKRTYK